MTPEQVARAQQERLERESRQRARRLAARKSPEADSRAIEERLVSVHPTIGLPMEQESTTQARLQLSLGDPGSLRAAIIYHEVFSAPKALRTDSEPWEM